MPTVPKATYTVRIDADESRKLARVASLLRKTPTGLAAALLSRAIDSMVIPKPRDDRQITIDDALKGK
jgi:hypothetical protein